MSSCILCLSQLRKTNSVKLTDLVGAEISFGDAIRQQIQYNIIPPYTPSSSQLTCKTCFTAFDNFYKYLTKVKSNLITSKTSSSFDIAPGYQQVMIASNEIMLKMEPLILIPKVKIEPEVIIDYMAEHHGSEYKLESSPSKSPKQDLSDRFNDDDSDFAWSYDDPMDGNVEDDEQKFEVQVEDVWDLEKYKQDRQEAAEGTAKKQSKKRKKSVDSDEDFTIVKKRYVKVADRPAAKAGKTAIKADPDDQDTPNDQPQIKPYRTDTGWIRYLPRSKITQDMIDAGLETVVINGTEYKIPEKQYKKTKPRKEKKRKVVEYPDPSIRKHPAHDPETEDFIRRLIDIKCYICEAQEDTFTKLKGHFRLEHPNDRFYLSCCDRKFRRRFELVEHLEFHDDSFQFACQQCNKTYKTKKSLKSHIECYHQVDESNKVICDECGKLFNNVRLLRNHMTFHNVDTSKIFECYICKDSKQFKTLIQIKTHMRNHHTVNRQNRMTVCHICSANIRESYLPAHLKTVHGDEHRKRIACEICNVWVLETTMKNHLQKHNDMGVTCSICGKFLKSKYSMTSHMKMSHGTDYKFKCEYCDKGFFKLIKMQEHVAVRHTREFLFRCRVTGCDRQFRSEANWRNHEKKYHPEEYDKLFKPFYKRDNKELKEFEELMEANGQNG
ncbi:GDNF-inducible zinc finger protein 1-like [Chironomus tepperi]|uniref:GDNF-inducible zinc finger protein 1-like n=1 Tax=Chironomus tepperi TaxID=113505 RepID=UPI00391F64CA